VSADQLRRIEIMDPCARAAIVASIGLAALFVGEGAGSADTLDSRVVGAWTTSAADCSRLFVRRGGALVYRQPVDKFAQAAIIAPRQIVIPATTCQVQSVSHENGSIKVSAECSDSISYTQQTMHIKLTSEGQIIYSPSGDPALDTTLVKCHI
jgi:hypothetical protein